MQEQTSRRSALIGLGVATAGLGMIAGSARAQAANSLIPQGAKALHDLSAQLERASPRRDFKSTPMILNDPSQWDSDAIGVLMAYRGGPKQVWDNTDIDGPWLNLMRNAMNAQIWSFKHPDFIAVSATHGSAHLALFQQTMWDKYQLAKLAGGKMTSNALIVDAGPAGTVADYENPSGVYSGEGDTIPALMRRGVVFLACHNAIWEVSAKLQKSGVNPDKLSLQAMAADLTNHLISGAVLTPGVVATIPELQRAGYLYIK
ncbi:MAG: thiosulfate dehydrogenase [Caulobacteraceae bacterium]